jgi:predicted RND superfamily exporter protein
MTLFFCSSSGSHDDRIQKALVAVFVPTVDSMLSTIFGCVALAGSEISLYVKFFFWMYFAVAVLGCLNGLLLLPVLLAWAGPSEFGGNPTATAKVSDVFSEPKGTADTKTKHPL